MCFEFELTACFGGGRLREDFGRDDSSAPSKPTQPRGRRGRQQQRYHHQDEEEAGRKAYHDGAYLPQDTAASKQQQLYPAWNSKVGDHNAGAGYNYTTRVRDLAAAAAPPPGHYRGQQHPMDFHHYPTTTYPTSTTTTTLQMYG